MQDAVPMLRTVNVCKSYGDHKILKGIDLEVNKGEVLCLLGPSGSGKSTFLRCINHLERINAGRIYVDGALVGFHGVYGAATPDRPRRFRAADPQRHKPDGAGSPGTRLSRRDSGRKGRPPAPPDATKKRMQ